MLSAFPVALWGWSTGKAATALFVYLLLGWVLPPPQPPEGGTRSVLLAEDVPLMFVINIGDIGGPSFGHDGWDERGNGE